MKKSDAISRSVTIFAILAVLSSLTFVACGKAGDKKKAPVRAADKTV